MSFSTATKHLELMGVDNDTANDNQREQALIKAFWEELPAGMTYLRGLVDRAKKEGRTIIGLDCQDPQVIADCQRLIGNVVPRRALQRYFGVPLESYNCHYPVTAPSEDKLEISIKTQIDLQNGRMASVDC